MNLNTGILADWQIQELCLLPERMFDQRLYEQKQAQAWAVPAHKEAAERFFAEMRESCMRAPTDEERAAFVPMITPFTAQQIRHVERPDPKFLSAHEIANGYKSDLRKIVSKGLTSYGYDVSLADDEVEIFTSIEGGEINPKRFDPKHLTRAKIRTDEEGGRYYSLPANHYSLARTVEYFRMPRDVLAICLGKSTYARSGIIINATPIEPGFEGNVVIEIANTTSLPARVYLEEGISQFLFFRGQPCETSYADRGGKYQGQTGVTLSKV